MVRSGAPNTVKLLSSQPGCRTILFHYIFKLTSCLRHLFVWFLILIRLISYILIFILSLHSPALCRPRLSYDDQISRSVFEPSGRNLNKLEWISTCRESTKFSWMLSMQEPPLSIIFRWAPSSIYYRMLAVCHHSSFLCIGPSLAGRNGYSWQLHLSSAMPLSQRHAGAMRAGVPWLLHFHFSRRNFPEPQRLCTNIGNLSPLPPLKAISTLYQYCATE